MSNSSISIMPNYLVLPNI